MDNNYDKLFDSSIGALWINSTEEGHAFRNSDKFKQLLFENKGDRIFNTKAGKGYAYNRELTDSKEFENFISNNLHSIIGTHLGRFWSFTPKGKKYFQSDKFFQWLIKPENIHLSISYDMDDWMQTPAGINFQETDEYSKYMESNSKALFTSNKGKSWFISPRGQKFILSPAFIEILKSLDPAILLDHSNNYHTGWSDSPAGLEVLKTDEFKQIIIAAAKARSEREGHCPASYLTGTDLGGFWMVKQSGKDFAQTDEFLKLLWRKDRTFSGIHWLPKDWLSTPAAHAFFKTEYFMDWVIRNLSVVFTNYNLQTTWLKTPEAKEFMLEPEFLSLFKDDSSFEEFLNWLGRKDGGKDWCKDPKSQKVLQSEEFSFKLKWIRTVVLRHWLGSEAGKEWLETPMGEKFKGNK